MDCEFMKLQEYHYRLRSLWWYEVYS